MDTVELLAKFADPEVMKTLSTMERLMAGLITTALGMGITFVALVVLQFVMGIMAKFSVEKNVVVKGSVPDEGVGGAKSSPKEVSDADEEVVAAIVTAIAAQLKTSVSNIVIRNIQRVDQSSNTWQKAGITEHMNNTL